MLYKIDPRKKNSRRWNGRYRSTRCNLSSRFYWIKYLSLIMNTVREPPLAIPCRSGWCPSINKCLRCKVPYGMRGVSGLPKQLSSKNPWSVLRSKVGFMVLLPSRPKNKTRLKRSLSPLIKIFTPSEASDCCCFCSGFCSDLYQCERIWQKFATLAKL